MNRHRVMLQSRFLVGTRPLLSVVRAFLAATIAQAGVPFEREMSTDRPDTTESPCTVERGRWQVETEVASFSRDSEDGATVHVAALGATNLKFGLTDRADLQVVFEPYVRARLDAGGPRTTFSGVGDTTVRLKINFTGNDGNVTATGVMPFLKIPTASRDLGNGHVEGGVIFPVTFKLTDDWDLALMAEGDVVRNDANDGYAFSLLTTASFAREVAPKTGMFFELANEAGHSRAKTWALSFNTGLTYALTPDLQLDGGVNLGLTKEAPDRVVFLGASLRW